MTKEKVNLGYRVKHWFIHHPWLKLIALFLAVLIWFYLREEIIRFKKY